MEKEEYKPNHNTKMIQSELITPSEVSGILKINYRKVLDMILMGDIPAYKIGRQYRIHRNDLSSFLKSSKIEKVA